MHDPPEHDGHRDPGVRGDPTPRRPILLALALAAVTLVGVVLVVGATRGGPKVVIGEPVPALVGTTLDGAPFDLASLRGRPVIINFWGPSCVPCRDEFPQFLAKLDEHGADGLAFVGVLTDDPPEPARAFIEEYGATWPTVADPDKAHQGGVPRRGPAADLLRRRRRDPAIDPDRSDDRRRLRAPVRPHRTMTSAVAEPAVVVDGLVKRYGSRTVLDGVSLTIDRGEVVALLGPNGAGKTTTVEIVEGYRTGDGGHVRVLGIDPASGGRALRARVGLMLQDGGVDRRARPRETLEQYAAFHAGPRDPDELLRLLGLETVARTAYRRLSGGERQRLGLAMALVGRPEVVILDEPTAGMDPEARAATRRIIGELRADGAAILMTSHDLVDVERLADRIAVLVDGRIVATGTPASLMAGGSLEDAYLRLVGAA